MAVCLRPPNGHVIDLIHLSHLKPPSGRCFSDATICYHVGVNAIKESIMAPAQLATRIDERVKRAVEKVCKARGEKMNHFIEEALLDKLEELDDLEALKSLRKEPTRLFKDVLRDLKLDGLL
jgi:hypothetical protein